MNADVKEEIRVVEGEVIEAPKVGRKTKYSPDLCEHLVEMASRGKTDAHFRVAYNIPKATFNIWLTKHEDFRNAKELADDAREDFYHSAVMSVAFNEDTGKRFNYPALIKLYDNYNSDRVTKESKGPQITVNIDNTGQKKAELTTEERHEKLAELKQKLLEDKGCQTSSTESPDLSVPS